MDLRLNDDIDEVTYKQKKRDLEREKFELKERMNDTDDTATKRRKRIEDSLDFSRALLRKFKTGSRTDRQEMINELSSNPELINHIFMLNPYKHFMVLQNQQNWEIEFKDWLEPQKYTDLLTKRPDLRPVNPVWLARWDDFSRTNWVDQVEYPDVVNQQTTQLLLTYSA